MVRRVIRIINGLQPYIRVTRILVTLIAPIILMVMYVIHRSYRTKKVREFIRNFKSDRAFLPQLSVFSCLGTPSRQGTTGILELT